MPTLNRETVLDLFRTAGALLEGHFRLSSGLHSDGYLQSALVLQDPRTASTLGEALAAQASRWNPTAVLSPALGGVIIGHEVGRALGVRAVFAERQESRLTLRRGFTLGPADRVLVVEDVVTTGLSTRETIEVARGGASEVVGAVSLIDRSGGRAELGVPYAALVALDLATWQPEACPLCASGIPVTKPGSRPTSG